ncbi:hypothetical protein EV363DRAFT_1296335 [Boletus edulis]|nr:hypothetical protein EV363DRAFT_1296335 [Boletus edulis]
MSLGLRCWVDRDIQQFLNLVGLFGNNCQLTGAVVRAACFAGPIADRAQASPRPLNCATAGCASESKASQGFLSQLSLLVLHFTRKEWVRETNTTWDTLNATVEGRLKATSQVSTFVSFDPVECTSITQNYHDRSAYNPPLSCAQGSILSYYVDVAKVSDVQAAVMFAKTNSIPLVIKNSGVRLRILSGFAGRSSAPGGLAMWISLVRNFVPTGCSDGAVDVAVTFGAGANFDALYTFADTNGITLPGGEEPTVGAGGGYLMVKMSLKLLRPLSDFTVPSRLSCGGKWTSLDRKSLPEQRLVLYVAWRGGGTLFGVVTQMSLSTQVHFNERLGRVSNGVLSRPRGACQTTMGDEVLIDEAMYIAAGMLFAGYKGIVGCGEGRVRAPVSEWYETGLSKGGRGAARSDWTSSEEWRSIRSTSGFEQFIHSHWYTVPWQPKGRGGVLSDQSVSESACRKERLTLQAVSGTDRRNSLFSQIEVGSNASWSLTMMWRTQALSIMQLEPYRLSL